jgi:hypothetical protein
MIWCVSMKILLECLMTLKACVHIRWEVIVRFVDIGRIDDHYCFKLSSGVSGEKRRPAASNWQTLLHNIVSSTTRPSGIRTHNVSGYSVIIHEGGEKDGIKTTTMSQM